MRACLSLMRNKQDGNQETRHHAKAVVAVLLDAVRSRLRGLFSLFFPHWDLHSHRAVSAVVLVQRITTAAIAWDKLVHPYFVETFELLSEGMSRTTCREGGNGEVTVCCPDQVFLTRAVKLPPRAIHKSRQVTTPAPTSSVRSDSHLIAW